MACLRIYNDWMIDEWCGGDARGRLVPLTLVPLWDPALAAEEVQRCAAKGALSEAFVELVPPPAPREPWAVEVELPSGVRLRLRG